MRTCTPASESTWFCPGKVWTASTGRGQIVVATLFMTWEKMRHEIDGRFDVGKKQVQFLLLLFLKNLAGFIFKRVGNYFSS